MTSMRWPNCSRFMRRDRSVPKDQGVDLTTILESLLARSETETIRTGCLKLCLLCTYATATRYERQWRNATEILVLLFLE